MKKKLFLISYGAGHISMIASLYGQFSKDNKVKLTVLALSIAKNLLNRLDIPHKTLVNYSQLIMDSNAYRYGKKLADRWHVDSTGITYNESVVYLGASMRDLVNDFGKSIAFDLINKKGRQIFLPIWTIQQIIEYSQRTISFCKECLVVKAAADTPSKSFRQAASWRRWRRVSPGKELDIESGMKRD